MSAETLQTDADRMPKTIPASEELAEQLRQSERRQAPAEENRRPWRERPQQAGFDKD